MGHSTYSMQQYRVVLNHHSKMFLLVFLIERFVIRNTTHRRCALGVLFPMTLALLVWPSSFMHNDRSLTKFRKRIAKRGGIPREDTFSWVYVYLFLTYMVVDFYWIELRTMLRIHHIVCILGHLLSVFMWKTGFPLYFTGAVVLEIGSAGMNVYVLDPDSNACLMVYAGLMTFSNILAIICSYYWCRIPEIRPRVFAYLWFLITILMAYLRQKKMMELAFEHYS